MVHVQSITLPSLTTSERLIYERVDWNNYRYFLDMFGDDKSIYVMNDYKSIDQLEEYIDYQLNYAQFSTKRGAADWFFKSKRTGEYAGVLNLYDLSDETINDNHLRCTIGFATSRHYREQYYTLEAVNTLTEAIFLQLQKKYILAYTTKDNIPTIELLQKADFARVERAYFHREYIYFEKESPYL